MSFPNLDAAERGEPFAGLAHHAAKDGIEGQSHSPPARRLERLDIRIVLSKREAESPLLPIREDSLPEAKTNATVIDTAPNNSISRKAFNCTDGNNSSSSSSSSSISSSSNNNNTTTTTNTARAKSSGNARRRSLGSSQFAQSTPPAPPPTPTATATATATPPSPPASAPVPPLTLAASIVRQAAGAPTTECRRRSSITSLQKSDGNTHTNNNTNTNTIPIIITTDESPDANASDCNKSTPTTTTTSATATNNNNNNNATLYNNYNYVTPAGGHTHTHTCSLYPKDSFSSIEGKAPRTSSKMQTKVDAVGRITGEWGKWQLRTVLLIFLCKIPSSWFMACIIFTAPAPRHGEFFCKPPSTVGAQNQTLWIKVSHPQKEEADDKEFIIDFCNVYKDAQEHAHLYYNYETPELEPKIWEEPVSRNANVIPCTEFQHDAEFHSVITQYDLVCSRDILVSVTQFFHLFGVLTGGILANYLLNYFSPRNVMLFGMVTQIFCGNLTGHVASYELHVFFRCLSAVCCAQMYTAGGLIMADITGGIYKTCVSTLFEQFWSIGVILLPGIASFFTSWSHLYMAISWPTVILIYLWQWIPDSPRWMVARGRVLDAKKILLECAEVNGTRYSLPHDIDQQLQLQAQTAMDAPPPAGWWSLWQGERAVRHMVCVHLCWAIYIVVYYGMLLNIRSFSREHLEVNTVIAAVSEIIGTFIGLFLILKTTRKWLWTGWFNIIAGCIAFTGWLVPKDMAFDARVALLMLSAMISKVAISTTLAILTTCTVELVSNDKKKICAFSTICWARFWLLGAPFIGATVVFGQLVPQTAFAALAIVGGILSTFISSPRTIPKRRKTRATNNMATATQIICDEEGGIDNKAFAKGPVFSTIGPKLTAPQSHLPPQLMPGIWTTKHHEDSPPL